MQETIKYTFAYTYIVGTNTQKQRNTSELFLLYADIY
jgi:hypothetical protein